MQAADKAAHEKVCTRCSIVDDTPALSLFCVCYVLVYIHREQCSVQAAKEAADAKAAADAKVQLRLRARWNMT